MLYFTYDDKGDLVKVSEEHSREAMCRVDMSTFEQACGIAREASALTGKQHIGVDQGQGCSPRYDVIVAPVVGAEVSKAFNGDYYPVGTIAKISGTMWKITTTDGTVFYRRGQSGSWISGNTWSMVPGHIEKRNPSF